MLYPAELQARQAFTIHHLPRSADGDGATRKSCEAGARTATGIRLALDRGDAFPRGPMAGGDGGGNRHGLGVAPRAAAGPERRGRRAPRAGGGGRRYQHALTSAGADRGRSTLARTVRVWSRDEHALRKRQLGPVRSHRLPLRGPRGGNSYAIGTTSGLTEVGSHDRLRPSFTPIQTPQLQAVGLLSLMPRPLHRRLQNRPRLICFSSFVARAPISRASSKPSRAISSRSS